MRLPSYEMIIWHLHARTQYPAGNGSSTILIHMVKISVGNGIHLELSMINVRKSPWSPFHAFLLIKLAHFTNCLAELGQKPQTNGRPKVWLTYQLIGEGSRDEYIPWSLVNERKCYRICKVLQNGTVSPFPRGSIVRSGRSPVDILFSSSAPSLLLLLLPPQPGERLCHHPFLPLDLWHHRLFRFHRQGLPVKEGSCENEYDQTSLESELDEIGYLGHSKLLIAAPMIKLSSAEAELILSANWLERIKITFERTSWLLSRMERTNWLGSIGNCKALPSTLPF